MSVHSDDLPMNSHRRHSSRSIKRRKFDDELVESSLPLKSQQRKSFEGGDDSTACISPLSPATVDNPGTASLKVESTAMEKKVLRTSSDAMKKIVSCQNPNDRKIAKRRKIKKTRQAFAAVKDMGRWKPTDDILLIDAVEQIHDLSLIHLAVKFSCRFTLEEIQERWYALLYDPVISALARQAMKALPFEVAEETHRKAPFSTEEEKLLSHILTSSLPTTLTFQELLDKNISVFHRLRTSASIEKHWNLMKQHLLIEDQTVSPLPQDDLVINFSDAEKMLDSPQVSSQRDDLVEQEINVADRKQKKEIKKLEEELPRWEVLVSSITGAPAGELDQHTVAALRGRHVRYLMRSREITIGRSTEYSTVDIDLSLEGPAYRVSRKQGLIRMKNNGEFVLTNEGKRPFFIDGKPVLKGNKARLQNESVLEIALLRFVFLINEQLIAPTNVNA